MGGARSGKSRFAEDRCAASGLMCVYVATAQALDEEMAARIAQHRAQRPTAWRTLEEPLELVAVLHREAATDRVILVDCLTLWVTNLMLAGRDVEAAAAALVAAIPDLPGGIVLVSNEVGQGVVPVERLARRFVDHAGRLHQRLAAAMDEVVLVTAGLPLWLKRAGAPPCTS